MVRRFLIWALLFCAALAVWPTSGKTTTQATVSATVSVFASITFAPPFLAFGNQQIGVSATKTVSVTNGGTAPFNITGISLLSGPTSGDFSFSPQCTGSIAVNASCQISLTFSPTAAGSASTTLSLSGSGRTYTAAVSGTGSTMPAAPTPVSIALSPMSIQIGDTATAGSIVSRATVTMSDGSSGACTLSSSDTAYYTISGMSIVLTHNLSGADDGQHDTIIDVVSCP